MNANDAIRTVALRDVWLRHLNKADDPDYARRAIFQYYSEHFSTPLHVVETLPIVDVIRAYWEHVFRNMSEESLEDAVREAALTEDDLKKQETQADLGEMEFDVIKAAVASGAYGNLATSALPVPKDNLARLGKGPPTKKPSLKEAEIAPKIDIADLEKLPESISIKFSDEDEDIEFEGDGLGLLEVPPSRASKT